MIIKSNSQFVSVDDNLPQDTSYRPVKVLEGVDASANAKVEKITIRINFHKISTEDCSAPIDPIDDASYADEIRFTLISPDGTPVLLVRDRSFDEEEETYNEHWVYTPRVEILFDDDASEKVGVNHEIPISGTFQPEEPLSMFNGKPVIGTWTLEVHDAGGADALCFYFHELIIETN